MHPVPAVPSRLTILCDAGSGVGRPEVPVEHLLQHKARGVADPPPGHDLLKIMPETIGKMAGNFKQPVFVK